MLQLEDVVDAVAIRVQRLRERHLLEAVKRREAVLHGGRVGDGHRYGGSKCQRDRSLQLAQAAAADEHVIAGGIGGRRDLEASGGVQPGLRDLQVGGVKGRQEREETGEAGQALHKGG